MKKLRLLFVLLWMTSNLFSSPVTGLLERIDKGASSKFIIERQKSETDFFELDQKGDKVIIRGNDYVNIATGLNWYLKYYAGIHEGGNLAASKIRNLECPSYEICLIDYGCGKFNRKIHIMEQYP